ncbi:hypothetical protein WBP07_20740 (plasmid) [Novosphingobium sp. BL-8A]|uniref:MarR family winged helix-turn-helix transcriptional regulator n=1 Tax=Novosphingobium sp. BL-8A TaxID=3127639 RepID=UPI0037572E9D
MSNSDLEPAPAEDFIRQQGPAYLAHLLRRLADELIRGGSQWYPEVGVTAPPRTTSTLLALDERGALGVTELASLLSQSHPLIIDWCRQLTALGFIETQANSRDRRRSIIALTDAGHSEVQRLRKALVIMERASCVLMEEQGSDVFQNLWRMEDGLRQTRFVDRLRQAAQA